MNTTQIKPWMSAFISGALFSVGLAMSGMTQPAKVIGFFGFTHGLESWDPSLAFVMGGGMLIYILGLQLSKGLEQPYCGTDFSQPSQKSIDKKLICGSLVFGMGWGLAGYCPGPVLASVGAMSRDALIVLAGMIIGIIVTKKFSPKKS